MKISKYVLPVLALAALASCGNSGTSSATGLSTDASSSTSESSSTPAATFEAYTLDQIHSARVAKTLSSLDKKLVSIKGKVTFAKRVDDNNDALTIQSGKHAIEVSYPAPFSVNVGDSVEVKGQFNCYKVGDVDSISISTYTSTNPQFSIKVIDEAISVETVTITKGSELVEFECSKAEIDFRVTATRKNAAFVGTLSADETQYIVANKLGIAEKVPEDTFAVGDAVVYRGVFSFSGNEEAKVIRYFDKDGFSKLK